MRSKKAFINLIWAFVELAVTTAASFIVPNLIIRAFGSGVNGLVSSIKQFLHYIALVESGIGAIGRASLYKPLASGDNDELSGDYRAIEDFYRKVAHVFLIYVVILIFLFPFLVEQDFDWVYTAILIAILAFSTFVQYYFGITNQTLIQSDQKKHISSGLTCITTALNTILTIILIKMGMGIHAVKIGSSLVFLIRPIFLHHYVKTHYRIDKTKEPRNEILTQRWDGLAQHIAFFIHKNTDVAVLTVLANLKEVSVYSVYSLAIAGCAKVVNIFSSSLEPAFGNMIARGEKETLKSRVSLCATITGQVAVILFSTTAFIITPFVQIYTKGVTDANYIRPAFGIIMLIAEAFYCVRLPYQSAVYAAGHFRQTRNGAVIEAVLNIFISVMLVRIYGLIGVAVGTLVSMMYRTIQYIWYYHVKLLGEPTGLSDEWKRLGISLCEITVYYIALSFAPKYEINGYTTWFVYSVGIGLFCLVIALLFSRLFYRKQWDDLMRIVSRFHTTSSR